MSWLDPLFPRQKVAPPTHIRATIGSGGSTYSTESVSTSVAGTNAAGIRDASKLRRWVETNPWIYAAMSLRRAQVSFADWDIIPKDAHESSARTMKAARGKSRSAKTAQKVKDFLEAPNVGGKNNSFGDLLAPVAADILTLDLGAILKHRYPDGSLAALEHIDATRVRFMDGWKSDKDGPRYIVLNENDRNKGVPVDNHDLITIQANPSTYSVLGLSPIKVLYQALEAEYDTFSSVWSLQKHRGPSGIVNLSGLDDKGLKRIRRMFEQELEGNSTVAFMNYPLDDMNLLELSSTNLVEQAVSWFYDTLVKQICSAFRVTTLQLNWTADLNRSSAAVQERFALDEGAQPLLRLLAGFINREIVSEFGDDNLHFVWTGLLIDNRPEDAQVLRNRAGNYVTWPSINELRVADGLEPIETTDPKLYACLNEPMVMFGQQMMYPLSVWANLPQMDPEVVASQVEAHIAANEAAVMGLNQPEIASPAPTAGSTQAGTTNTTSPTPGDATKGFDLDREIDLLFKKRAA